MFPYQNSQFNFPIGIFPRLGIGTKPIGHNWIQLDSVGLSSQLILDLIGLDWTFSQLRQNWFHLVQLLGNKISNWKYIERWNLQLEKYIKIQLIPIHLNQTNRVQLNFQLDWVQWSKILFQFEIQYSNINQLTPTQYQLNPIHSNWISNWNELAILVRDGTNNNAIRYCIVLVFLVLCTIPLFTQFFWFLYLNNWTNTWKS